jgi:putative hydrolase of the HAD superfamily
MIRGVFFDVDFTLIYPGPTFRGEGYSQFCARYGMEVDASLFDRGVESATSLLESPGDVYDADVFVAYTRHIIEQMGGRGDQLDACAREIYDQWAACRHFELYEEVPDVMRELVAAGVRIGLISNSHRCLSAFQHHFDLQGLVAGAISGPEHGYMKPNTSIFRAALALVGVDAADAVMVGDSVRQDIEGALRTGMRAVLLHRPGDADQAARDAAAAGVALIRSLAELPRLLDLPGRSSQPPS